MDDREREERPDEKEHGHGPLEDVALVTGHELEGRDAVDEVVAVAAGVALLEAPVPVRAAAAVRDVRPLGHRRAVDAVASRHR